MKSVSAVLLSGGSGSRMGGSCPKQFLELNGKPVFAYALEALSGFPEIGEIVIVYREGTRKEIENIIAALKIELPPLLWQSGGETRRQSVAAGLALCSYPVTLLHETARPLVTRETVAAVLRHPAEAVTLGCEIPFTVAAKFRLRFWKKTNQTKLGVFCAATGFSTCSCRKSFRRKNCGKRTDWQRNQEKRIPTTLPFFSTPDSPAPSRKVIRKILKSPAPKIFSLPKRF